MTAARRWDAVRRRIPGVIVVPVLAFLALGSWALSSAAGSSPDDDFHLASIWCGDGSRGTLCEPGDAADEREVPRDLAVDSVCYAYHPEWSAACQGNDFGQNPDDTVVTDRGNFAGLYPPVFYAVTGLFASDDVNASVVAIRLVNAALFVGVVTAAYLLLPRIRRPALLAGVVLTVVPLGMFIIPSTNPSSWALLSAAVLWISLVGYFETTGRRRIGLAIIAGLATVLGGGARADAAAFAVMAVLIAGFLSFRRERSFALQSIYPAALIVVSVFFYLSASQSGAAANGLTGTPPSSAAAWAGLFLVNLVNAPQLWIGVFGQWGLGWLDTAMPAAVWVGGFGVFAAAIALSLRSRSRRVGIVMLGLLAALFLLPSYILTQSNAVVGGYFQPRYLMPLLVILGGVALLATSRRMSIGRVHVVIGGVVIAAANSLALFVNLRRYVTGIDSLSPNLNDGIEWWWPIGISPMAVWILGSLIFAAMLTVLALPLWAWAGRTAPEPELEPAALGRGAGRNR